MEDFEELEEKIEKLKEEDKLELLIDIVSNLQGKELKKVFDEYNKKEDFYNFEYNKAQDNYYQYEKIYNILCYDIK